MANNQYIADHLTRLVTEHRNNPQAQLDSLRRIADNADILGMDEPLTEAKQEQIKQFCQQFVASPQGQQALIEQKVARARRGYRQ